MKLILAVFLLPAVCTPALVDPGDVAPGDPEPPTILPDDDDVEPPGCPAAVNGTAPLPEVLYGQDWPTGGHGTFNLTTGAYTEIASLGENAAHINQKFGAYNPFEQTLTYSNQVGVITIDALTGDVLDILPTGGILYESLEYDGQTGRFLATRRIEGDLEIVAIDMAAGSVHTLHTIDDMLIGVHNASGFRCDSREYVVVTRTFSGARTLWVVHADDGTVLSERPLDFHLAHMAYDVARESWFAHSYFNDGWTIARLDPHAATAEPITTERFSGTILWELYDPDRSVFWFGCTGIPPWKLCGVHVDTGALVVETQVDGDPFLYVPPRP